MIRPTMSHAANKDDLHKLMSQYATYLEQQLEIAEAERDEALTWVAHFQDCSTDECMCGSKMNVTCGHGGCVSTADYRAFPNAESELHKRDLEQRIKGLESVAKDSQYDSVRAACNNRIKQLLEDLKK